MENTRPLVSVILPVCNGERTVGKTIESILWQSYDNMQIIIVDDASSDSSREIIESYDDPRIEKIFFSVNHNVCLGSNIALKSAKGKYIGIIGHDDIWEREKLEKQVCILEEDEEIAFCSTDMYVIDENDNSLMDAWEPFLKENEKVYENMSQEEALLLMLGRNYVYAPSVVMRKSCIDKVGFYKNALVQTQDYDLWLRLLTVGKMHAIKEKLIRYRQNVGNRTNLSAVSIETVTRQEHEIRYSVYNVIKNMENDLFFRVFKDFTKGNPNPENNNEIMCEKACVLAEMENPFFYLLYVDLVEIDECREYLENKCNFGLKKFYEFNKAPIRVDNTYYNLCNRQNEIIKMLSESR